MQMKVSLYGAKKKLNTDTVDKGRFAASNQMLADMNQFVPKDDNNLRTAGHATRNGREIIWNSPYAGPHFYGYRRTKNGTVFFRNYTTPGTGPRWDLKASGLFMSDWIKAFTKGAGW